MITPVSSNVPYHIISEEIIKTVSNNDLSSITYLNLHGNCIKSIENLDKCINLRTLILSFNQLSEIDGLNCLCELETLILSFNMIKHIEGLEGCKHLKKLDISSNLIYKESDILFLSKCCKELEELNLNFNRVTDIKDYRYLCLNNLKNLKKLDSKDITPEERENSLQYPLYPTLSIIEKASHNFIISRETDSLSLKPIPSINSTSLLYDNKNPPSPIIQNYVLSDSNELYKKTISLDLNGKHLHSVANLNNLQHLKQLILSNNVISNIDGLSSNVKLEELILNDNSLPSMNLISNFTNLVVLDLSSNRINNIYGLEHLKKLTQLSLENNDISSLKGLGCLNSLLELYIANNKLNVIKEIQVYLKPLPKLLILDLSGNPLSTTQNYRLFTIYNLRKLKVLDGVSIDSVESNSAKEQYSGKLTKDFLLERLGNHSFDKITELDISGCRIKDIECLTYIIIILNSGSDFCSLQSLILDNNYLTNINGLKTIPSLLQLKINNNRIEELIPDVLLIYY